MAVSVGDTAPDFTLKHKTADGLNDVSLSDYKGKSHVVLLFFPLAFSTPCTEELCSVSNDLSNYESLSAQVLGISVDNPLAQEAWAEKVGITFPLLSDFGKSVSAAYGSQYDELLGLPGVAKRSAFVIDKEGIVRYASVSDDAKVMPDFGAIKSCLESLS